MKNIHILPTDKPSRLYSYKSIDLYLHSEIVDANSANLNCKNQNIYITSEEPIKEGDRFIAKNKAMLCTQVTSTIIASNTSNGGAFSYSQSKKIILTTDQDLIKDGVQAIDDNFLEWFVNNPSCEEVEVKITDRDDNGYGIPFGGIFYNIFIPKEEPKQPFYCSDKLELDDNEKCTTQCDVCSGKPKQETLEEAPKEKLDFYQQGFADGFKIQQERSYSEEEVLELLNGYDNHIQENFDPSKTILSTKEWFEQNKKK
jgi:hypothetical protein